MQGLTVDGEGLAIGSVNVLAVEDTVLDEQRRVVETELPCQQGLSGLRYSSRHSPDSPW